MKLDSLWIYVPSLTPPYWNKPSCPPVLYHITLRCLQPPSAFQPPTPTNTQHLLLSGEYPRMPWHPSPSQPLTFLIWQMNKAVLSPRNITATCKAVEWLAVVKHNE